MLEFFKTETLKYGYSWIIVEGIMYGVFSAFLLSATFLLSWSMLQMT